jgi:endo-1,4-beta-xylanase
MMRQRAVIGALTAVVTTVFAGHAVAGSPRGLTPALRDVAPRAGIAIGAAVAHDPLMQDNAYRNLLTSQFNMFTPENAMKWGVIHPAPDRYDFSQADDLANFARVHHMKMRGHNLTWWSQNPTWLETATFSRDEAIRVLRDHIYTVVRRYKDVVTQWDVVNEGIDEAGNYRMNPWLRMIGPDYFDFAFRFAHAADPKAKLFYNDFAFEAAPGPKHDEVLRLVTDLKRRGVPIDGVGFESHDPGPYVPPMTAQTFTEIDSLGFEIAVTEADFPTPGPLTQAGLTAQANAYKQLLEICLRTRHCHTFFVWGLDDGHSWEAAGKDSATLTAPLPFDGDYQPKPAAYALRDTLMRHRRAPRR